MHSKRECKTDTALRKGFIVKGIQNIETNRAFTLEELEQFTNDHWDTKNYCSFQVGKPTPLAAEEAILFLATPRHLVVGGPVAAGGLLGKKNSVALSVARNECVFSEAFTSTLLISVGVGSIAGLEKTMSINQEKQGPAEEIFPEYTAYLQGPLSDAGYLAG